MGMTAYIRALTGQDLLLSAGGHARMFAAVHQPQRSLVQSVCDGRPGEPSYGLRTYSMTRALLTCVLRANNRTIYAVTLTCRNQSSFSCPAVLAYCQTHITLLLHCFWIHDSGHSHSSYTWHVVQLHVTERQSIPNLTAEASEGGSLPALIEFDSLKSLPQRDYLQPHYESQQQTSGT